MGVPVMVEPVEKLAFFGPLRVVSLAVVTSSEFDTIQVFQKLYNMDR